MNPDQSRACGTVCRSSLHRWRPGLLLASSIRFLSEPASKWPGAGTCRIGYAGVRLAGLVPCLRFQEWDRERSAPKRIIHNAAAGHAGRAEKHETDVAFDRVVAGPDCDCIREALVPVVRRRAPEIHLRADALHISREHCDIVALPLAVVKGHRLLCSPPLDGEGTAHIAPGFL